jgi:hypothetical protein
MQGSSLSKFTVTLMVCVALFFDLVQFLLDLFHGIPVVGNAFAIVATALLSVFAFLVFWFWFFMHGIRFNTAKRLLSMGGGFIFELIPILNALPAWTLAVIVVITTTKIPQIAQIASAAQGKPSAMTSTAASVKTSAAKAVQTSAQAAPRVISTGFDKRPNSPRNTRNPDGIRPAA